MTPHAPATSLALPDHNRPAERLPPAIALPIILALSVLGWYGVWQIGTGAMRLIG